jgi:hypothetical protein
MSERHYLVSYGTMGDLGRAGAVPPLVCARGDEVVLRGPRGLELATVLCEAGPGHEQLLGGAAGEVLRLATPEDRRTVERMRQRGERLFADARQTAAALGLPLEILDVEVLLDGRHAVLHHLRLGECDPRDLMDRLGDRHQLLVSLRDVALPPGATAEEEPLHIGCGAENCGAGGCGSCSSGNCSSCGSRGRAANPATPPVEAPSGRVPVFST